MRKLELKRAEYTSPGKSGKGGFTELECYRLALDVVVNAYELARHLPAEEKFDLAAQIRRASKSVPANIAEGYGRYHYLESLRHYYIARGELNETLAHFTNALVIGYIEQPYYNNVYELIRQAESTLNGFIAYVRKQRQGLPEFGEQAIHEELSQYIFDSNPEIENE